MPGCKAGVTNAPPLAAPSLSVAAYSSGRTVRGHRRCPHPGARPPLWIAQPLVQLGSRELLAEVPPSLCGAPPEKSPAGAWPPAPTRCVGPPVSAAVASMDYWPALPPVKLSHAHRRARHRRGSRTAPRIRIRASLSKQGSRRAATLNRSRSTASRLTGAHLLTDGPAVHRRSCSVSSRMTLVTRVRASRPTRRVGGLSLESRRTTP